MFIPFVNQLKIRLSQPLPGEEVQLLMAPPSRPQIKNSISKNYFPKKSAVLILVFPDNKKLNVLLIERSIYDGVHSGQVAFPGGKFEESDIDLKQTSLRELFEEVGVHPEEVEIIGNLSDVYISPSNYLVSPFVGYSQQKPNFVRDEYEVQNIITLDLFQLNNSKIMSKKNIILSHGVEISTPCYDIQGLTIWGATAMMISELNAVVEETRKAL